MTNENMHSEEVYDTGLPSVYMPIPVRTVIQECEIRRSVRISVRAIVCPELRMDLFQYLLISTVHVVRRDLVPLHKKVPYALYSNLSSLDNLMMAYTQGRNM